MNRISKVLAAVATAAVVVACGGGGDGGGGTSVPVAATNTSLTFNATTGATAVQAILNKGFAFPTGVPQFGTVNPTTVTIAAGAGGTYNYTIKDTVTNATTTGVLQFGSCIFKGNAASPIPALTVDVVINPCGVEVATANKTAGATVDVPATLSFGTTTSSPTSIPVTINPTTGSVTVNNVVIGTVSVKQTTGTASP